MCAFYSNSFPSGQRNNNKKEKKSAVLFPIRRNNYDVEISYPMNRQNEKKNILANQIQKEEKQNPFSH